MRDIGYMESALTGSPELLVLSDEIIGWVKRMGQGIRVDEETLAVEVIDKVGPGGHFLGEEHTLKYFKKEIWYPQLLDRRMYSDWVASGSLTLGQCLNQKTRELLDSYVPEPLPDETLEKLKEILVRAEEREAMP
jgi:trimethylamine--corrinoid protein Co-methyltransferase